MCEAELYGNPWMLKEIYDYLTGVSDGNVNISNEHRIDVIKEHLNLLIKDKGEYIAIREMRKHICWYVKNLKDSAKVRQEVNQLETKEEVVACLTEYFINV